MVPVLARMQARFPCEALAPHAQPELLLGHVIFNLRSTNVFRDTRGLCHFTRNSMHVCVCVRDVHFPGEGPVDAIKFWKGVSDPKILLRIRSTALEGAFPSVKLATFQHKVGHGDEKLKKLRMGNLICKISGKLKQILQCNKFCKKKKKNSNRTGNH